MTKRRDKESAPGHDESLSGVRICLVFEHSLAFYTRLLQEIAALKEAGAEVELLTGHASPDDAPAGMRRTYAPLSVIDELPASNHPNRARRIATNTARNAVRPIVHWYRRVRPTRVRESALRDLRRRTDIFWVIDEPSLPTTMRSVRYTSTRVVYETLDLVPEFLYQDEVARRKHIAAETRLISRVDGFITVCDSYADYYSEPNGRRPRRRPMVRNDMPATIAESVKPASRPLRFLFLGALMYDRPVKELMEAVALVESDMTLTFQGANHLGNAPTRDIAALGLQHKIILEGPCAADDVVETAHEYDVGVVALRGLDENERRASTTKLFTYMAAGIAVIGSDLPGVARVMNEHHNGLLVEEMTPACWAAAIDTITSLPPSAIDRMKQHSLEAAQHYAWDKQRPEFIREFVKALGSSRRLSRKPH